MALFLAQKTGVIPPSYDEHRTKNPIGDNDSAVIIERERRKAIRALRLKIRQAEMIDQSYQLVDENGFYEEFFLEEHPLVARIIKRTRNSLPK